MARFDRRRRGFDDDDGYPPVGNMGRHRRPSEAAEALFDRSTEPGIPHQPAAIEPPQAAKVKWYRDDKGFGFCTLTDTGQDLFLSRRVVGAGADLPPGTTLTVRAGIDRIDGKPAVLELIDIDLKTARQPVAANRVESGKLIRRVPSGAGFVSPDLGGLTIYLPGAVFTAFGDEVQPASRLEVECGDGERGPVATRIVRVLE